MKLLPARLGRPCRYPAASRHNLAFTHTCILDYLAPTYPALDSRYWLLERLAIESTVRPE